MKEFIDALLHFDMDALFRRKTTNTFIQFFRYIFVGGISFVVDAAVLWLCERFMHYLIAAAIAFIAGLAVNYVLSVCFVFSESASVNSRTKEFIIYVIIGVIGLLLTEALMYLCTDVIGLYFMLSKIIASAIVLAWNFIARKKILYSNK